MPDSGQDHTTDLVLWNPAFFGSKPDMIIKGGMIVASKMGDANASIPTTQPVCYQPMFAAHGKAKQEACRCLRCDHFGYGIFKGGANMTNEMSLSFSATLENEPFVRTCIASFVVCLNPTVDEIVEIKTIVGEAVSNAIIHGYNGDKGCLVKVKAYIEDDLLTIYVIDKGQGIQDIEKARQPMFTSKKELEHAGMGLSIIEALCDEMTIESSLELGTQLIMKKRIVHE